MKILKKITIFEYLLLAILSLILFLSLDPFILVGCNLSSSYNTFCNNFNISIEFDHFDSSEYGFSFLQRLMLFYISVFFYSWVKKNKNTFIWKKRYFLACNIIIIIIFTLVYSETRHILLYSTIYNRKIQTPGWRIDCPKNIIVTPFYIFKRDSQIKYCEDIDNYSHITKRDQLDIFGRDLKKL